MLVFINNTISLSVIQMEPPCTVIQCMTDKSIFQCCYIPSCTQQSMSADNIFAHLGCSGLTSIQSVMFTSTVNYRVMYLNFEPLTLQFHRNVHLWLGKGESFLMSTSGSEDKFVILLLESSLLHLLCIPYMYSTYNKHHCLVTL